MSEGRVSPVSIVAAIVLALVLLMQLLGTLEASMWLVSIAVLTVVWLACGVLSRTVAESKGRDGAAWFLAGFLLGPLGLLAAAGMPPAVPSSKCRACRMPVDPEASICPHCRSESPNEPRVD